MTRDWTNATDEEILHADIIIELGLDSLPLEQQQQAADQLMRTCQEGMLAEVLLEFPSGRKDELQVVLDKNDPAQLLAFLGETVPNVQEKAEQVLIRFKRTMLSV